MKGEALILKEWVQSLAIGRGGQKTFVTGKVEALWPAVDERLGIQGDQSLWQALERQQLSIRRPLGCPLVCLPPRNPDVAGSRPHAAADGQGPPGCGTTR